MKTTEPRLSKREEKTSGKSDGGKNSKIRRF